MTPDPIRRRRFEAVAHDVLEPLQRYLRRRAAAADADDVVADALLVIWRRLDDVPDAAPLPWCYGVARRCLANNRRGRERHLQLVDRLAGERPAAEHLDPQVAVEQTDPALAAAIGRLTDSEAEIVRLWAWERLEPREIATVLDLTPNAVSVALSRARRKLRDDLDGDSADDPDRQDRTPSGHKPGVDATEQEGDGR